jgi:hypothetical protein
MRKTTAPRVTIENVTYVRFCPTYEGPVETAEQVEMRLLALSYAAATKQLRVELEIALRIIAWAQASSVSAYEAVSEELQDRIVDSGS